MAIFGPLLRIGKGAHRTHKLPQLIQDAENKIRTPILSKFSGAERFEAASKLIDADIFRTETGVDRRKLLDALDKLEREFRMAQNELSRQTATKADVVSLGIVVREMAVGYDLEVAAFQNARSQSLQEFVYQSSQALEQSRRDFEVRAEATTRDIVQKMEMKERDLSSRLTRQQESALSQMNTQLRTSIERVEQDYQKRGIDQDKAFKQLEIRAQATIREVVQKVDMKGREIDNQLRSAIERIEQNHQSRTTEQDKVFNQLTHDVQRGILQLAELRDAVENRASSAQDLIEGVSKQTVETELTPVYSEFERSNAYIASMQSQLKNTTNIVYGLVCVVAALVGGLGYILAG